MASM
ncbi:hypothetical protein CFC21_086626, partial [Triticum aestivum]|jgi:hypothetical protein